MKSPSRNSRRPPSPKRSGGSHWARLPTEGILPGSEELDRLQAPEILDLLDREDHRVVEAVAGEARRIARAARWLADCLAADGRCVLLGAGTSGRLGVLEAAECPPTFGTRPDQILALMAGGRASVFRSREGAEDERPGSHAELRRLGITEADLLIGISASSVTSFVEGGLEFGRGAEAKTILVTCGRRPRGVADLVIAPQVGAEPIAGSTRLKAGTATKMVLNRITVLAMVRLNKVHGPFMVDLAASSSKLRDRARRIVSRLANVPPARAQELLETCSGRVKTSVLVGRSRLGASEAESLLRACHGSLRRALRRVGADA